MTPPTESEIQAKMQSAQVSRAWAIIMLEPAPNFTAEDYRADYERMRDETDAGFTGAWALSQSSVPDFTLDDVDEIPYESGRPQ